MLETGVLENTKDGYEILKVGIYCLKLNTPITLYVIPEANSFARYPVMSWPHFHPVSQVYLRTT
jgi:hypothetical protein